MRKTRLLVLMIGCAVSGLVMAQNEETQDPEAPKNGAVPEMTAEAGQRKPDALKLSVNLSAGGTDNRDSSATAKSAFDFSCQPRIDARTSWADDSSAVLYYAPSYRYLTDPGPYQNDGQLFHDLGLNLKQAAGLLKLRANDYFNYTDDPAVQEGSQTLRSDASFILNRVDAGAVYLFSPRYNLDVHGQNTMKRYDKPEVAKDSDEDSTGGGLTLWRRMSNEASLLIETEATQYGYDSSAGFNRDFSVLSGGLGLDTVFSPNLRLTARAGYQSGEYDDATLDSAKTPYGSLGIRATPANSAIQVRANASYSLRGSEVFPFASQKNTALGANVDWEAVPGSLLLSACLIYQVGSYSSDALPSTVVEPVPTGERKVFTAGLNAAITIDPSTSVTLGQVHDNVSSDVGESFKKNTTTLTLSRVF